MKKIWKFLKKKKDEKKDNKSGIMLSYNSGGKNTSDYSSFNNISLDISKKDWLTERIFLELNSNNEELFDGKDYESRVKNYLKLFLECCTEQDLNIESNPGREIKFVYKLYEKLIKIDESKKNENIAGNSINSSKVAEFDFMIKNIKKKTLINFLEFFEGNTIYKSGINSLNEQKNYQIIGEIAKNLLHQSSDKIKQINKYVDIILINDILKKIRSLLKIRKKLKRALTQ